MVQFPGLNKKTIKLADGVSPLYIPLLFLTLLLAHRAQISSASSGILPKDKVLTLASIKWNSKQIANSPLLQKLYATLAIMDTLAFEQNEMIKMSPEESVKHLDGKSDILSQQKKPKNARLVPRGAINENTLEAHRHGKIAQYIGLFQSKPVFDPSSVFPNMALANLSISQLFSSFHETMEKLEIQRPPAGSEWANWIASAQNPEEAEIHALKCLINSILNMEGKPIIFDDGIGFGSDTNLLPIESVLNMERPISSVSPPGELNDAQKANPFLVAAVEQQKSIFEEAKAGKQTGSPKARQVNQAASQKTPTKRVRRTSGRR